MDQLPFSVRTGRIQGKDHNLVRHNCQDGLDFKYVTVLGKNYLIGAVADGCGEGRFSEVAAILLPVFIVNEVRHLLEFETPVSQVPTALYPHVVGFLSSLWKQIPLRTSEEMISFIKNHLLATVIGFVLGEDEGVVFYAGDGVIVVGDAKTVINYDNKSPYIGYHLVPRSALKGLPSALPMTFESVPLKTTVLERLVVATDGFSQLDLMERLLAEAKPVPLGIQLWMNLINGNRNRQPELGVLMDDAAVIVVERIPGEVEEVADA